MHTRKAYEEPVAAMVKDKFSQREREDFHAYLREVNLNRLLLAAVLTLIGETLLFFIRIEDFLLPGITAREIVSFARAGLMAVGICAFCFLRQKMLASSKAAGIVNSFFLAAYLAFQIALLYLEYPASGTIYKFLIGLLLLSAANVAPAAASAADTALYCVFAGGVVFIAGGNPATVALALSFSAAAVIIDVFFYTSYQNSYLVKVEFEGVVKSLAQMTTTDQLTSIGNRRGFERDIQIHWDSCMRRRTPLALLMIDVDKFKQYNENYGNLAGDQCLADIASCLGLVFQRKIDLFARCGGDEFVVAMQDMDLDDALQQANRLREQVNSMRILNAFSPVAAYVTVSVGVACIVPERSESYENLMRYASRALYKCKASGGNCVRPFSAEPQDGAVNA